MPYVLSLVAALLATGSIFAADTQAAPPRKIAIIVENHANTTLNDQTDTLEDLISSRVAGQGFSVISRDVVIKALHSGAAGSSSNLDEELSRQTSALRLAQNLGADFILVPTITSYGTEKKTYNGNGVQTLNTVHRLRVSYKIAEANEGGALRGGTFVSEKSTRDTANLQTDDTDILNELLDDAASQLAAAVNASAESLPTETARAALVSFNIACTMTDPRQQPVLISDVSVSAEGKLIATNPPVAVQPMDVTVELDGVALGSTPGEFKARPGLHKLRLSREGFADWNRTVNIYDGQTLRAALQMSPEGYAKWKDTTDFLATLDAHRKLTDAEVKRVEGLAAYLNESHYRVDTKENLQIMPRSTKAIIERVESSPPVSPPIEQIEPTPVEPTKPSSP